MDTQEPLSQEPPRGDANQVRPVPVLSASDQPYYINAAYNITDSILTDHLYICQWYTENIDKFIQYNYDHKSLSQEVPLHRDQQAQPVPEVPPADPSSASATFSETLTQEEVELLRQFRATSNRSPSPTKKAKLDQEPDWHDFLQALSAKHIDLSDLDYNLPQQLRTSERARTDFLTTNLTTPDAPHFDPEEGKYLKIDLTKKLQFHLLKSLKL